MYTEVTAAQLLNFGNARCPFQLCTSVVCRCLVGGYIVLRFTAGTEFCSVINFSTSVPRFTTRNRQGACRGHFLHVVVRRYSVAWALRENSSDKSSRCGAGICRQYVGFGTWWIGPPHQLVSTSSWFSRHDISASITLLSHIHEEHNRTVVRNVVHECIAALETEVV